MKVLVVIAALFVVCASGSKLPKHILDKLIPSFTTGYIINGEDAQPHAAPYIVSLSSSATKHSHICGGTIIDKEWILTAAHCIKNPVGMGVAAGLHGRTDFNSRTQFRTVDYGKVHEAYTGGVGPNDIAMLHISEPLQYNEFVKPAALPARQEIHSGETHLYGWGQPKPFQFTAAKTLQTVQTEIVEWNECKAKLPDNAPLAESNICSGSLGQGISACNGDSGGPLVVEHNGGQAVLIGIVSWGYIPCGMANLPSIYTRTSSFIDWVSKVKHTYYSNY